MMTLKSNRRFPLGQVVITQGALNDLPAEEVQESLLCVMPRGIGAMSAKRTGR